MSCSYNSPIMLGSQRKSGPTATPAKGLQEIDNSKFKRKPKQKFVNEEETEHSSLEASNDQLAKGSLESYSSSPPLKRPTNHRGVDQSPLVLSPSAFLSPGLTPDSFSRVWDSQDTPSMISSSKPYFGSLTPLTPPTRSVSTKVSLVAHDSSPSRSTKCSITFEKLETLAADETQKQGFDEKDVEGDDYFIPKKLFRNMTEELDNIAKATAAVQHNYNLRPLSFDFTAKVTKASLRSLHLAARVKQEISERSVKVESPAPLSRHNHKSTTKSCIIPPDLLQFIIPSDTQQRLAKMPKRCVASLVKDAQKRCTTNHKSHKSPKPLVLDFKAIEALYDNADYHDLISSIQEITKQVMCGSHINVSQARIDMLHQKVCKFACLLEQDTSQPSVQSSSRPDFGSTPSNVQHRSSRYDIKVEKTRATTNNLQVDDGKWQTKSSTTSQAKFQAAQLQGFTPYQPKAVNGLSISEALLKQATKQFGANDTREGYIYMFWDKEHFGKVKIGYTNDLDNRLRRWNTQCKREHSYHNSSEGAVWLPHVLRVELLIHTELKDSRLKRQCEGCGKMHIEWFDENEKHAVRVLKKWQEWILQQPYVQDPVSGQWSVRPEMREKLEELCKPAEREKRKPAERRRSSGVKTNGTAKRRSPRQTL